MRFSRQTKRGITAVAIALAATAAGCVHSPENGDWVDPFDLSFSGYAQHPSATIEIEAFDQHARTWRRIATATSSATATTFGEDRMFAWSLRDFDFSTVASWECYWGYGGHCSIPAGSASTQIRFREVGSDLPFLVTFDEGGVTCVVRKVTREGQRWRNAGAACASSNSGVLTLRWLT